MTDSKKSTKADVAKADAKVKTENQDVIEKITDDVADETPDDNGNGITDEPQHEEHLNMSLLGESPVLREVYLAVSDDRGGILGDEDLEEKVRGIIEEFQKPAGDSPERTPEDQLAELKEVSTAYAQRINVSASISDGALTKYRIRLGTLFHIQKKLAKRAGRKWLEWFAENYDERHLRSVQDFMALAKVPNIIRYAVFGKERLTEIQRTFKVEDFKKEDPIGDFLKKHKVVFDPESDETIDSWRAEVDAAIAFERVQKVEAMEEVELGADPELLKSLIRSGIPVDNRLIGEMVIVANSGGDVNALLRRRFANNGSEKQAEGLEEGLIRSSRMLEGIPKLVARFKDTITYLSENKDLLDRLDRSHVEALETQVAELRALITEE